MRIGLNLLYLIPGVVGGTETYARGLLAGLAKIDHENDYLVFVNRESASWPLPPAPNFTRVPCPVSARNRLGRYLFEQFGLPAWLKARRVEVVHSLGYVTPLRVPCPSVVTVHDLNYRALGKAMPFSKRLVLAFFARQSVLRSDHVITVSEFSRREIEQAFGWLDGRITVTYEAPRLRELSPLLPDRLEALCARLGVIVPFLIAFSSQHPHKNIPRLLQAFAQARQQYHLPHRLVVVGHPPANVARWPKSEEGVCFTGYLPDDALQAILSQAALLILPSLYEGFGLPILEAMAIGVPVVCSNRASLPEIAGDAALMFDPLSVEDMAQKIAMAACDQGLREELRRRGLQNAGRFTWEKTARQTLAVYQQVVGEEKQ